MCDRARTITHMQIPRFHTQVWYNWLNFNTCPRNRWCKKQALIFNRRIIARDSVDSPRLCWRNQKQFRQQFFSRGSNSMQIYTDSSPKTKQWSRQRFVHVCILYRSNHRNCIYTKAFSTVKMYKSCGKSPQCNGSRMNIHVPVSESCVLKFPVNIRGALYWRHMIVILSQVSANSAAYLTAF